MSSKYQIKITRIITETKKTKEYEKLYDNEAFLKLRADDPKIEQYDYVETELEEETEERVYTQVIADLDLVAVIEAVNRRRSAKISGGSGGTGDPGGAGGTDGGTAGGSS